MFCCLQSHMDVMNCCDELTSEDDYLPDLISCENDSHCIAPERSNVDVSLFKLKIFK